MRLYSRSTLIAAAVIALAQILGGAVIFWGFASSVIASRDRIAELQTQIGRFGRDRADAAAARALVASRRDDIAQVESFFPDQKRPIAFLEALDALGQATGNTSAVNLDEHGGDARYLAFNLNVAGTSASLLRYLKALQLMPYKVEIKEIAYQNQTALSSEPSGGTVMPSQLRVSIRVRTK